MTNDEIKQIALANGFKCKTTNSNGEPDLHDYVYQFARALLDKQTAWIPVSLGLPDDNDNVLIYNAEDNLIAEDYRENGIWQVARETYTITHWCKYPDPPLAVVKLPENLNPN